MTTLETILIAVVVFNFLVMWRLFNSCLDIKIENANIKIAQLKKEIAKKENQRRFAATIYKEKYLKESQKIIDIAYTKISCTPNYQSN